MNKITVRQWRNLRRSVYALAGAVLGYFVVTSQLDVKEGAALLIIVESALACAFFMVPSGGE